MTFGEFKKLEYPDQLPLELVLSQIMYDGLLSTEQVMSAYTRAIEKDRWKRKMRFEEACTNLTQLLNGLWRGKDLKKAQQRAIHTLNMSETLPHNIYNDMYDYTEETKKEWDEFCEMIYGKEIQL
jgi:hypothetical protein